MVQAESEQLLMDCAKLSRLQAEHQDQQGKKVVHLLDRFTVTGPPPQISAGADWVLVRRQGLAVLVLMCLVADLVEAGRHRGLCLLEVERV